MNKRMFRLNRTCGVYAWSLHSQHIIVSEMPASAAITLREPECRAFLGVRPSRFACRALLGAPPLRVQGLSSRLSSKVVTTCEPTHPCTPPRRGTEIASRSEAPLLGRAGGGYKAPIHVHSLETVATTSPCVTCLGGFWRFFHSIAAWIVFVFLGGFTLLGSSESRETAEERARRLFTERRDRFERSPSDADTASKFGRACFDWAEFARRNEDRKEIAEQGISAGRRAVELGPDSAEAHYFLALNLGQLAKTKQMAALGLVGEMERELKRAIELDSDFERGAPDRSLGLLYLRAPGWPLSIGNKRKGLVHLERAVQISPDYPENRLCVLEAVLKDNDQDRKRLQIKAYQEMLPRARAVYSGPEWETDWVDWDARWREILRQAPGSEGTLGK